jgi:hypothetical protein
MFGWGLQALEIALLPEVKTVSPQLVYNISVCYWNIIRPLVRPPGRVLTCNHTKENLCFSPLLKACTETHHALTDNCSCARVRRGTWWGR